MEHFSQYLIEKGYKTYRRIPKESLRTPPENAIIHGDFYYIPFTFNSMYLRANYNTMRPNHLSAHFVKEESFDCQIIHRPEGFTWPNIAVSTHSSSVLVSGYSTVTLNSAKPEHFYLVYRKINEVFTKKYQEFLTN